jgi:hypothetical protein
MILLLAKITDSMFHHSVIKYLEKGSRKNARK